MISKLYLLLLVCCLANLAYLSSKTDKQVDRYLWTVLVLFPVIILGYWLKSTVHTPEAAMLSFCFIYIDSTVILTVCFFSILRSIRVNVSRWVKMGVYSITLFHLLTIWLSKDNGLYYEQINLIDTGIGIATKMISGPLKITHYIYLGILFVAIMAALLRGIFGKGTYSRRVLFSYSFCTVLGILIYVYEMAFDVDFSLLPFLYTLCSFYMTIYFDVFQSHNIHTLIGEKQSKTGLRGFVAFNTKKELLGYNKQFAKVFPEIEQVVIDTKLTDKNNGLGEYLYPLLDRCIDQGNYTDKISYNERIYSMAVSSFSVNGWGGANGYLLELSDTTEEENHLELIKQYNERLGQDVKEKTKHIQEMQNSVVLGMANLVENRDNNTGGHVKRTSDIIKILVKEAVKQGLYNIDEEKIVDIVRAAPMHDLGKMYIATEILCKPARLTDDEFVIMKSHASKSGEMVTIILEGVEESHFVMTAYNIARYHHERWDGKGYPEGLMGEEIPMEARIMSVADVYDALVSKRCYKEAMTFEEASRIMNENMGTQFDPAMRPVFNACRAYLEEYYSKQ